jgi:long-chain acyl-CoA synthetase
MEKIWLKSYPPGVPAEIDVNEFSSIGDLFSKGVQEFGERAAYTNMGMALSYADLDRLSRQFASFLQQQVKGPKGTRVALMMPNLLQYPIAMFGAVRAGSTVVNVNPLYTARELEHQLKDSGAEAIVVVENFARTVEQVLPSVKLSTVVVTSLGEMLGFPKRQIVNFVVRHVKKWCRAGTCPGTSAFPKRSSVAHHTSFRQ